MLIHYPFWASWKETANDIAKSHLTEDGRNSTAEEIITIAGGIVSLICPISDQRKDYYLHDQLTDILTEWKEKEMKLERNELRSPLDFSSLVEVHHHHHHLSLSPFPRTFQWRCGVVYRWFTVGHLCTSLADAFLPPSLLSSVPYPQYMPRILPSTFISNLAKQQYSTTS